MSPVFSKFPGLGSSSDVELLRQKLQRISRWNCPSVTEDPGFGQMPPGMMWIRTDMVGCERYRFYDENGNVVTLCFEDEDVVTPTPTGNFTEVLFTYVAIPDDEDDMIVNTATETAFANFYTIPANDPMERDIYRVRAWGTFSNLSDAECQMNMRMYIENQEILTTQESGLLGEGVVRTPVTSAHWRMEVDIGFVDVVGSGSAHCMSQWWMRKHNEFLPNTLEGMVYGSGGTGFTYFAPNPADITITVDFDTADPDINSKLIEMSIERLRIT